MIHNTFGYNNFTTSDMANIPTSSYDPVFYLHHNYVDRQYAYYQALQDIRGTPVEYQNIDYPQRPIIGNPKMPPFSGILKNPLNPTNISIPNPISLTRENSKPSMGLNYQKVFGYKYDSLMFDGRTPEEFISTCPNRKIVGVNFDGVKSLNKIYIQDQSISESVGEYGIIIPSCPTLLVEFDITPAFNKHNLDFDDSTFHFEVESFDLQGNVIAAPYKPTSEYINMEGERIIRYHTTHFEKYNPLVKVVHLSATIEFVNADGSLSNEVNVIVDQHNHVEPINGSVQLTSTKHQFLYGGYMIEVGFSLDYYVKVSFS